MSKMRLLFACIVATAALGWAAPAGASECAPEEDPACQPCGDDINPIWRKVTGRDLIVCPW